MMFVARTPRAASASMSAAPGVRGATAIAHQRGEWHERLGTADAVDASPVSPSGDEAGGPCRQAPTACNRSSPWRRAIGRTASSSPGLAVAMTRAPRCVREFDRERADAARRAHDEDRVTGLGIDRVRRHPGPWRPPAGSLRRSPSRGRPASGQAAGFSPPANGLRPCPEMEGRRTLDEPDHIVARSHVRPSLRRPPRRHQPGSRPMTVGSSCGIIAIRPPLAW